MSAAVTRRGIITATVVAGFVLATAGPALACGGLVSPNGTVELSRTVTLAAYHEGVEHYVTSFTFEGGSSSFGSITPLPGVPTEVKRGGSWTLQRLEREVAPPAPERKALAFASSAGDQAQVLLTTKVDALDITVLSGGAREVVAWTKAHGYQVSPDATTVLGFYARRSPVFMVSRFDAAAAKARGQQAGDGTPIQVSIPTPNPWVPLRILALAKTAKEQVTADVFLLTDRHPALLSGRGITLARSEPASTSLLTDLHSDKGMSWVPTQTAWLSFLKVDARAGDLTYDLAVDTSGAGQPSAVAAGLVRPVRFAGPVIGGSSSWRTSTRIALAGLVICALVGAGLMLRSTRLRP